MIDKHEGTKSELEDNFVIGIATERSFRQRFERSNIAMHDGAVKQKFAKLKVRTIQNLIKNKKQAK